MTTANVSDTKIIFFWLTGCVCFPSASCVSFDLIQRMQERVSDRGMQQECGIRFLVGPNAKNLQKGQP